MSGFFFNTTILRLYEWEDCATVSTAASPGPSTECKDDYQDEAHTANGKGREERFNAKY